jgi:hypothetical protein
MLLNTTTMQITCYFHSKFIARLSRTYTKIGKLTFHLTLYVFINFQNYTCLLSLTGNRFVGFLFRYTMQNSIWFWVCFWVLKPRSCQSWGWYHYKSSEFCFIKVLCLRLVYVSAAIMTLISRHIGVCWGNKRRTFSTLGCAVWWHPWTCISGYCRWKSYTSMV